MKQRRADPCGGLQRARPPRAPRIRRVSSSSLAFTLVELLVVIGIIAVLIALLVSSVTAARRQANMIKCGANLRQLGQACAMHAQEHRGYFPLAGMLQIDWPPYGSEMLPTGFNDIERKKYTYASATSWYVQRSLTPFPASLAPYLGVKGLNYSDTTTLDLQLNDPHGVWQYFMCPATDSYNHPIIGATPGDNTPDGQAAMMSVTMGGWTSFWWSTNSDFGMNEVLLGYDYRPQYSARRLGGNAAKIRNPANVLLLCDALPSKDPDPTFPASFPYAWLTFAPVLDPPANAANPVTLANVLADDDNMQLFHAQLDQRRHKGRLNVLFADGHVDAMPITPTQMQRVSLTPR